MSDLVEGRRPTRAGTELDVPPVDAGALAPELRTAIAELLLAMADDEFVQGFRDSEWTGIAPMLEEDVAFSSLAQDEIGHARVLYGLRCALTGEDPDELAFGREPAAYHHCRLLDPPRGDWAFSICRRYLYDTADAVRLGALQGGSWRPLTEVVGKIRREEGYHLLHLDAWVRRLADGGEETRGRLVGALDKLWPDALSVLAPIDGERLLIEQGVLKEPMLALAVRQWIQLRAVFGGLGIPLPPAMPSPARGRRRSEVAVGFHALWDEFTSVRRLDPRATW